MKEDTSGLIIVYVALIELQYLLLYWQSNTFSQRWLTINKGTYLIVLDVLFHLP